MKSTHLRGYPFGGYRIPSPSLGLILGVTLSSIPSWSLPFSEVAIPALAGLEGQFTAAAWADYDGDQRPDFYLAMHSSGPGILFRNTASGFEWVQSGPISENIFRRGGAAWGDLDNDGRMDLFVSAVAGEANVIYRNLGGGEFAAITNQIEGQGMVGISPVWVDVNNDGNIDVFVANGGGAAPQANHLFLGLGDGAFEKVTSGEMVEELKYSQGAAFADFDGDGYQDVIVVSLWGQEDSLLRNNQDGTFTKLSVGEVGGVAAPQGGVSAAWGDIDNDGDMDLIVITAQGANRLYRNDGTAGFMRLAEGPVAEGGLECIGAVWADFDNDGILDLIIARRSGRHFLYRGLGGGAFDQVTTGTIAERTAGANGVAVADYDGDGALDVLLTNWSGNSKPALFRNLSTANGWLRVKLEGTTSNRSGIGAKVRVRTTIGGQTVWQLRQVGGFDSVGSHELVAHFGLGNATQVDLVRIEWPSGIVQEIPNVAGRQVLSVTEATTPSQSLAIEPNGGFFTNSVVVTLRSMVVGAQIRYTLDGNDPGPASTLYTAPLTITEAVTVKARLYVNNFPVSEVVSATFEPEPVLRFHPPGMWFTNRVEVAVQNRLTGASTRYTLDGSEPTLTSPLYETPIALTATTSIRARAYLNGFPVSDTVVATYSRVVAFDNEGIPAAWRIQYFGEDYAINPQAAAEADPDGDGATNRQEYVAGTHPLDPLSGFRLGIRAIPEIRFHSVVGQKYRVLRLQEWGGGVTTVVAEITAQGEETVWVDGSAEAALNPSFYLVEPVP